MKQKVITIPSLPAVPAQVHAGLALLLLALFVVAGIFSFREFPFTGNPFEWVKAKESYKKGVELKVMSKWKEALGYFRAAALTFPNDARFQSALADCELRLRHVPEAEQALNKTISLNKDDTVAWAQLSRVYAIEGNAEKAETTARQALKLSPLDPIASAQLGLLEAAKGNTKEAETLFANARKVPTESPLYYSLLGRYYHLINKPQEMEAALRESVSLDTHDAENAEWLGLCLATEGRLQEANEMLSNAAKLDDTNPEYWKTLSQVCMTLRKYRQAAEALTHLVELQPNDPVNRRALGIALYSNGNLAQSEQLLQNSIEQQHDDGVSTMYFLALFRQRKLAALEQQLRRWSANKENANNSGVWVLLADTLAFEGKESEAREAYKHLLTLDISADLRAYAKRCTTNPPKPSELEHVLQQMNGETPAGNAKYGKQAKSSN